MPLKGDSGNPFEVCKIIHCLSPRTGAELANFPFSLLWQNRDVSVTASATVLSLSSSGFILSVLIYVCAAGDIPLPRSRKKLKIKFI